jgi:GntR family transcriptional regulator
VALPSEFELVEYYGVSRATVRQALHSLEQQGLITKKKGRGSFVAETVSGSWLFQSVGGLFDDELSRRGLTIESEVLRGVLEPLPDWATHMLQLSSGTTGVTLERLRHVDNKQTLYVVDHLPPEYAGVLPAIKGDLNSSLYRTLRDHCGVEPAGNSRVIEAVAAGRSLARHLDVPIRSPLVFIQSVVWDGNSKPIDCYRAWLRTDRLRLAMITQS